MKLNFFTRELQDSIKKSRADIKELQATIIELKKGIDKAREEQIRQQRIIERLITLLKE